MSSIPAIPTTPMTPAYESADCVAMPSAYDEGGSPYTVQDLPIGSTVDQDYSQLMNDVAATGTSAQTLEQDVARYQQDVPANLDPSMDALNGAVSSISDNLVAGSYSQQGTEASLVAGANDAGLTSLVTRNEESHPELAGLNSSSDDPNTAPMGSLGVNANILEGEMKAGAPLSQIQNNANALATQAQDSGDSNTAFAASNIANSLNPGDGSYNPDTSVTALSNAVQQDS